MTPKLAAAGIQLVTETKTHFLFVRDNFIALVERRNDGFGSIGSTGMMTENGLAYLVWRGEQAFLKSKTGEQPAAQTQVDEIRRFSADLTAALTQTPLTPASEPPC